MVFLSGHSIPVFKNREGRRFWENYLGFSVYSIQVFLSICTVVGPWIYQNIFWQVILEMQRHIKHFLFSFQDHRWIWWEVNLISLVISHQPFLGYWGCYRERCDGGIPIKGGRCMLFWFLAISRTNIGAVKERYCLVPCLFSRGFLRGNYVVLWLKASGWLRLTCYSRLWSFLITLSCIVLSILVLFYLYWSVSVSGSCCQTTSGAGRFFAVLIVSGLLHAAPKWRRGVSSLKFGLQLKHSHLNSYGNFFVGPDSVLPADCHGEAVY